jgi:hypothetical protein
MQAQSPWAWMAALASWRRTARAVRRRVNLPGTRRRRLVRRHRFQAMQRSRLFSHRFRRCPTGYRPTSPWLCPMLGLRRYRPPAMPTSTLRQRPDSLRRSWPCRQTQFPSSTGGPPPWGTADSGRFLLLEILVGVTPKVSLAFARRFPMRDRVCDIDPESTIG